MRVAFLSDAHGNAVAIDRCLSAVRALAVDAIYFLGDAVGYLPGEQETLRLLLESGAVCQAGNHEAMILDRLAPHSANEPQYQHHGAASRLGAAGLALIREWPERREIAIDGRRFLLVHGSPANPLEGTYYPDSDLNDLAALPYDVIVMGHTHRPFVKHSGSVLVINAGSAGLPRDQGDAPSFAVYDSNQGRATIYRVRVSPEAVMNAYRVFPVHDAVRACLLRVCANPLGEFVRVD